MIERDPQRLLDDPTLNERQHEALRAGRAPVAYDVSAGLARFRATLAGGGGASGSGAAVGSGPPSSGATGAPSGSGAMGAAPQAAVGNVAMAWQAGGLLTALSLIAAAWMVWGPEVPTGTPTGAAASRPDTSDTAQGDPSLEAVGPQPKGAIRLERIPPARIVVETLGPSERDASADGRPTTKGRRPRRPSRVGSQSSSRSRARRADTPRSDPDRTRASSIPTPPSEPVRRQPTHSEATSAADAIVTAQPQLAPNPAPPPPRPPASSPHPQVGELGAVARARSLLRSNPEGALSLLRQLDQRQPRGHLMEERRALEALALAGSGESARAERAAEAFVRDYPHSPYVDQVRRLLDR